VDGELLAEVVARETDDAASARHFARLGAIMAAMHDQATGWTPPAGFQRHALDADGLLGPAPFWGPFWEHPILSPAERRLLLGTRDRLHAALRAFA
jgi:Ser/Thr protein kinase RdoA (MazF antagonist)